MLRCLQTFRLTVAVKLPWGCCPCLGTFAQQFMASGSSWNPGPQVHSQLIRALPSVLVYRKTQACLLPQFQISITLSLGIEAAARPAAISIPLIFRYAVFGCSKRDVRARSCRFFQGITFAFGLLVGPKLAKKSTASTRKAADNLVRSRLDFERALPNEGFALLVYCSRFLSCLKYSGWRSLLKSSNIDSSRRVLGMPCKSSLV